MPMNEEDRKAHNRIKKQEHRERDKILSEATFYVVIGHTLEQKDSLVVYAGHSQKKAKEYAAMADNLTYYTQLEIWKNGERQK